jgi:DNA-binding HxlR family transcriptional regulator
MMRPGAKGLSLLAVPLNVHILQALEAEERSLSDLGRAVGHPPTSTMRVYLRTLTELGVLERQREVDFPGSVTYALTRSGEKLLAVGEVLAYWLRAAPDGPISPGSTAAKSAIKALVDGWSSSIVRAIAARPLSLTELNKLIPQISYPALERRLTAMRRVGLIEARANGAGRATPYRASSWLRASIAPLSAAVGWEQQCCPSGSPLIGRLDVEATFLLAIPLIHLPSELSGVCRLAVELRGGSDLEYAGVTVAVEEGRAVSCVAKLGGDADAWVGGSPLDWFRWVNGREGHQIELGGDASLGAAVAEGLREALVPGNRV